MPREKRIFDESLRNSFELPRAIFLSCKQLAVATQKLQKPPIARISRSIRHQLSRDILRLHLPSLLPIPSLVVNNHICTQAQRQQTSRSTKCRRGDQGWEVLRRILRQKDITAHHLRTVSIV